MLVLLLCFFLILKTLKDRHWYLSCRDWEAEAIVVMCFYQGHTAIKWFSQVSNRNLSLLKPVCSLSDTVLSLEYWLDAIRQSI